LRNGGNCRTGRSNSRYGIFQLQIDENQIRKFIAHDRYWPRLGTLVALQQPVFTQTEAAMTAISQVLSRVFLASTPADDAFKQLLLFCCAGLLVSLLLLTDGLDLSPGFL
jgi:hypothetical protein